MKCSIFATGVAAFMSTLAQAQFTNQSPPFQLVVLSSNSTINGTTLGACHEGAAIEGLCPAGSLSTGVSEPYTTYYFNTSSSPVSGNASIGEPGVLSWHLVIGSGNGTMTVPEALRLTYNPTSNVAVPIFFPDSSTETTLAFDSNELLNIQSYIDDTTVPASHASTKAYYQWYLCTTYYSYTYTTLAWVMGVGAQPQNPTCQKVQVKRVYNAAPAGTYGL